MNQKFLHYAYLFVKEELKVIGESIESESNINIKKQLISRKNELENDLLNIESLKE
ncbi:hypothetical protein [Paenibacillus naphthalenovorans]|uniref:Uncharacterized protein n=1 Tax=Paenibacillus naphthalenovorans TaxID=162209 RepID=A0A0U2MWJ1_9BACL|nr:hypothetical protein [Paenibacillus naphthalenovorans]ALS22271.1 hypothetical protein IJ22_18970 [Paenibacillus naphthalenovorans]